MTRVELIEMIENGSDIMFSAAGRNYTILTWTEEGIAIGERFPNDHEIRYFTTAEELVDGFMIGGKSLGEQAMEIRITEYT